MNLFKSLVNEISRAVKISAATGVACIACHDASAQGGIGFDFFKAPRFFNLGETNNANASAASITNLYSDVRGAVGISTIILYSGTNQTPGTGTNLSLTCNVQVSPDQTNWFTLTNYALVTSNTTSVATNLFYGANTNYASAVTNGLLATNNLLFPYSVVVPNAATAGFATPYGGTGAAFAFTNGGTITLSNAPQISLVGFNISAMGGQGNTGAATRYLRTVWTFGASNFWNVGSVLLTGTRL